MYPANEVVQTTIDQASITRDRRVSAIRLFAGGCAAAALIVLIGFAIELYRLGTNDEAAAARLEADVRASVVEMTTDVEAVAHEITGDAQVPVAMAAALEADEPARALFDAAARGRQRVPEDEPLLADTIYDQTGVTRAWAGRASDLPPERTKGPASLFVTPSPLGLRLVYLEPIVGTAPPRMRLGAAAVEHVLTPAPPASILLTTSTYTMPTPRGPVALRLPGSTPALAPDPNAHQFVVMSPDGAPLLDASVRYADIAAVRARLRRTVAALAMAVFATTILLLAGPLLDRRATARHAARELRLTALILVVVVTGIGLLSLALVMSCARSGDGRPTKRFCSRSRS